VKYNSALNKKGILMYANTWMKFKNITSEKFTKRQISYASAYGINRFIEKKFEWRLPEIGKRENREIF
jgi:hypothetical protein